MENQNATPYQLATRWGMIAGLVNVAAYLLLYIIDKEMLVSLKIVFLLLLVNIALMVVPIVIHKRASAGLISFKNAFLTALVSALVGALISDIFMYILYNVIDTELAAFIKEKVIANTLEFMEKFNTPQEAIDKAMADLEEKDFSQSIGTVLRQFFGSAIFYAVVALIVGAITKKNNPSAPSPEPTA